jgi:hypothetical protein
VPITITSCTNAAEVERTARLGTAAVRQPLSGDERHAATSAIDPEAGSAVRWRGRAPAIPRGNWTAQAENPEKSESATHPRPGGFDRRSLGNSDESCCRTCLALASRARLTDD